MNKIISTFFIVSLMFQTVFAFAANSAGNIVIPINEIDSVAKFYSTEIDGVKIEVLAVKAPDGTIRTAFNTCQVCYNSGRGYYRQSGAVLICQNCGNRFPLDKIEKIRGGCNPVPITDQYKMTNAKNIVISKEFLSKAKVLFANWRKR